MDNPDTVVARLAARRGGELTRASGVHFRRTNLLDPLDVGLVPQHELRCIDGRRVRLDFSDPVRRIAVEGNGHRWHGSSKQLRADMARRRSIQASGWTLYEYGWSDVTEAAQATRVELARTLSR